MVAIPTRYGDHSPRRRAVSVALTVAAHLLIAWLLLHLAPRLLPPDSEPALSTFDVSVPRPAPVPAPAASRERQATRSGGAPPAAVAPRARRETETPPERPTEPAPTGYIPLDFALSRNVTGAGTSEGANRGDSVVPYGPGAGPGGERMYNAEWQREPSSGELNGNLPNGVPPGGWAMIACRAAPGNTVENCRILGEGPPGSGLARAMRQAAWQFRVLPPRIGGKPMLGAWIRIRFDWTARGLETR